MRRRAGATVRALATVAILSLALVACAPTEAAPRTDAVETFPPGGVPTQVFWPSDWLEGLAGEADFVRGSIVGLSLSYRDDGDEWTWRIQSRDPDRDSGDETRGFDADVDAVEGGMRSGRHIDLEPAQRVQSGVSALDAARLSGETYPGPRLVSLWLDERGGAAVWEATLYENADGRTTRLTIDATSGDILPPAP